MDFIHYACVTLHKKGHIRTESAIYALDLIFYSKILHVYAGAPAVKTCRPDVTSVSTFVHSSDTTLRDLNSGSIHIYIF
jgi:hypothetical protein